MKYIITESQYKKILLEQSNVYTDEAKYKKALKVYNKKSIKNVLFKYWDKNGPSLAMGKYFSLSEDETSKYLVEYHGNDAEETVKLMIKELVNNYHHCDGDNFNLRCDSINFIKERRLHAYSVHFSIDYVSQVFDVNFDFADNENLMVLYGQLEGCVEQMLNDTIYETYGFFTYSCFVNGIYDRHV
jgi:hypothetical protein